MAQMTAPCTCRKHAIDPRCPRHGNSSAFARGLSAVAAFYVALVIAVIWTAHADAHRNASRPGWMSPFAWAVAVCETGKGHNHPDFRHHSGSYGGAWGWFSGTWLLDRPQGFPSRAYLATPREQYRVFQIGRARGRYWGCIANGGYRSWM